jgi:TetR/AcrR family transcriptional repressor of acrEF/envCD operon
MNNDSFNLYQQAPALVDSILATLHVTRVSPHDDACSAPGKHFPVRTKRLYGLRADGFT